MPGSAVRVRPQLFPKSFAMKVLAHSWFRGAFLVSLHEPRDEPRHFNISSASAQVGSLVGAVEPFGHFCAGWLVTRIYPIHHLGVSVPQLRSDQFGRDTSLG